MKVKDVIEKLQKYNPDQEFDISTEEYGSDDSLKVLVFSEENGKVIIERDDINSIMWACDGEIDDINEKVNIKALSQKQKDFIRKKIVYTREECRKMKMKSVNEVCERFKQGYEAVTDRFFWWWCSLENPDEDKDIRENSTSESSGLSFVGLPTSKLHDSINFGCQSVMRQNTELFNLYKDEKGLMYFEMIDKENFVRDYETVNYPESSEDFEKRVESILS